MYQKTGTLQLPARVCVYEREHTEVEHLSNTHISRGHTSGLGVVLKVGLTLIKEYFEKKRDILGLNHYFIDH